MGRPIKSKFFLKFGGKTPSLQNTYYGLNIALVNSGTNYSQGATITIGAPNYSNGIRATASIAISTATQTNRWINSTSITNNGSGYSSTATVTVNTATARTYTANSTASSYTLTNLSSVVGIYPGMLVLAGTTMTANTHVIGVSGTNVALDTVAASATTGTTFTFVDTGSGAIFATSLTAVDLIPGTIAITAYLTTGSSAVTSAIVEQRGARSYFVENAQGHGRVKLVTTSTLTAGQGYITATDFGGAQYYIKKFNGRKATVIAKSTGTLGTNGYLVTLTTDAAPIGTSSTVYTTGVAKWTTASSVANLIAGSAAFTGTTILVNTNTI
jgi:hypothetical protein